MGLVESSCCKNGPALKVQTLGGRSPESYVCTEWSHVESLLAHLPPEVHAALEEKAFQRTCHETFWDIIKRRNLGEAKGPFFLEGDELVEAVQRSVPECFSQDRLHLKDLRSLLLAFDVDNDGRISSSEFDLFCMWTVAMNVMGFFAGTTPFAKISNDVVAKHLLIISEFLDPEHILGRCALPTTVCAYYHPDGITLDEFSAQIESAAYVRTKQGRFFESVALANHGPDENGIWSVCSDHPVSLKSLDTAWPRLMPMFRALADMVASPAQLGHVDLLACNFAANQTGIECLEMIERQVPARFAASIDATGNVAVQGNWELERGDRNVAPIYFHEEMLGQFTKVMQPSPNLDMLDMFSAGHQGTKEDQELMDEVLHGKNSRKHKEEDQKDEKEHKHKDRSMTKHMMRAAATEQAISNETKHKAKAAAPQRQTLLGQSLYQKSPAEKSAEASLAGAAAVAKRKAPVRHDDVKKPDAGRFDFIE